MLINGDEWWKMKHLLKWNIFQHKLIKFIETQGDKPLADDDLKDEIALCIQDVSFHTFRAELRSVLLDKTKGEARNKVKSVEDPADGANSYRVMNNWFTRISNQGLAERRSKVMAPDKATKESQIVGMIEGWEKRIRDLKEMEGGKEEPLSDKMMMAGLQRITCGAIESSLRKRDFNNYEEMRAFVMKYRI